MVNQIVLKQQTREEFARQWTAQAWEKTPSLMVTVPYPGGVLFGAENHDRAQRVSFFLAPEDARTIGQRLINAATEADYATS